MFNFHLKFSLSILAKSSSVGIIIERELVSLKFDLSILDQTPTKKKCVKEENISSGTS